jgi:hypothetical protein
MFTGYREVAVLDTEKWLYWIQRSGCTTMTDSGIDNYIIGTELHCCVIMGFQADLNCI